MKLTEDQARDIVFGDTEDYEEIDQVEHGDIFKNYQTITTIVKDKEGKTFGIDWQQYTNHYGDGDHLFYDCELVPITEVEVVKKEWVYQ